MAFREDELGGGSPALLGEGTEAVLLQFVQPAAKLLLDSPEAHGYPTP